tara:strand:+ start:1662 stop:1916 length:255 start_codon:yes stop_codon:yes gene_type:complete
MSLNKEDLKNKIIYRATYRGTKEMDILILNFVSSVIDDLDNHQLIELDKLINFDDESLISIKKKESKINFDSSLKYIIEKFQNF